MAFPGTLLDHLTSGMVARKLKRSRLVGEQGFTLIELLIVVVIIGVLTAIAIPTYFAFVSSSHTAAAESNVRTAIPAAQDVYDDQGQGAAFCYTSSPCALSGDDLRAVASGIAGSVKAVALNGGAGYCIEDSKTNGSSSITYSYIGGNPGSGATAADVGALKDASCTTDDGGTGAA